MTQDTADAITEGGVLLQGAPIMVPHLSLPPVRFLPLLFLPFFSLMLAPSKAAASGTDATENHSAVNSPTDFTGTWELNEELSDDPREKIRKAMSKAGGRRSSGRGGFGGRSGGFGAPGARSGGSNDRGGVGASGSRRRGEESGTGGGRGDKEFSSRSESLKTLQVIHLDPEVLIRDAQNREMSLYTDGRTFEHSTPRGPADATADWKRGGRLKIKTEFDEERSQTETWELVAEGQRLYITTEIGGGGKRSKVEIRRIYDRVQLEPSALSE